MRVFGYEFKNESLIEEALTTPSYRMIAPKAKDNQRLEFLGDAVLEAVVSEELFKAKSEAKEGELTVARAERVSTAALCKVALAEGLRSMLKQGPSAAPLADNSKVFADAVEAVIGAIYLDGGLEAVRTAILSFNPPPSIPNPKGDLQIKAQAMTPPRHPVYTLIKTEGKAHDPRFTVKVEVEGLGEAVRAARTRKEAEASAALALLDRI